MLCNHAFSLCIQLEILNLLKRLRNSINISHHCRMHVFFLTLFISWFCTGKKRYICFTLLYLYRWKTFFIIIFFAFSLFDSTVILLLDWWIIKFLKSHIASRSIRDWPWQSITSSGVLWEVHSCRSKWTYHQQWFLQSICRLHTLLLRVHTLEAISIS